MGGQNSKCKKLKLKPIFSSADQGRYMSQCVPLHKAALKGDWEAADKLMKADMTLLEAGITENGETAFHVAALEGHSCFVAKLLEAVEDPNYAVLELQNKKGGTALSFAAATGHVHIARIMISKNPALAKISGCDGVTPLYMAALQGHTDMADYLFPLSAVDTWPIQNQIDLLTTAIESGFYGLAAKILYQSKMLAVAEDRNGDTPLQVLAKNPSAFCGLSTTTTQQNCWTNINNIACRMLQYFLPCNMKLMIKSKNLVASSSSNDESYDAYTLLVFLWDLMVSCHQENAVESGEVTKFNEVIGETAASLLFTAADSENDEFMVELISRYPDLLYKVNESRHSIFHIAVLHRHVQAFNLLHEIRGVRDMITTYIDTEGNNMLHLAAKLAPPSQLNLIPGAALQMQREVLWYKEVENMVRPSYRKMKNIFGQTPHDLFMSEHQNLMKEGEKLMKQTAKSCMLVTMLIATVVFTTAFTVPGGFNNITGAPTLQNEKLFVLFPVSEAVATLSSLTSMLMFLSILTSRYAENDFLESLPFWLVVGVASLFVSIVAMMVAFCTCLILYQRGLTSVMVILLFFASVPVMFIILKYHLLVTVLRSTYGCRWLFRSHHRLFSH